MLIKLPPRPNCSNVEHFVLFVCASALIRFTPWYVFLACAVFAIEIDQAMSFCKPWWAWFTDAHYAWDTWYDIAAGLAAIALAWGVGGLL